MWPHRRQPTRLPRPWDSPGKNTGVGCHFLLQCVKVKSLSHVRLLATPWTAAYQAPPSMAFSRQEYWSGASQVVLVVKNPSANTGDAGSIPGPGRSPGEENGNPLQYSCLENSMERGAWQATVHRAAKNWTQLKQLSMNTPPFDHSWYHWPDALSSGSRTISPALSDSVHWISDPASWSSARESGTKEMDQRSLTWAESVRSS